MSVQEERTKFSRLRIAGLDVVRVYDVTAIQSINALPEVKRAAEAEGHPNNLPWLFRWFFPKTGFFNPALDGWYLAFRGESDPTYAPCRAFLDQRFSKPAHTPAAVTEVADLLLDEMNVPTDRQLSDAVVRALWGSIVPPGHPPIPEEHLSAAVAQIASVGESVLPWKLRRGIPGAAGIFQYVDDVLHNLGLRTGPEALPDPAVTDVANIFFALSRNMPAVLRRIGERYSEEDVNESICAVGPTESVPRMVSDNSTLGGLLPSDTPALPGKTVILLHIADAARATVDESYIYAAGPGQRVCPARGMVTAFLKDIHTELLARNTTRT